MNVPNFTAECQCGEPKARGALFCDGCFASLPRHIQSEINVRIRDFHETAEKAATTLIQAAVKP